MWVLNSRALGEEFSHNLISTKKLHMICAHTCLRSHVFKTCIIIEGKELAVVTSFIHTFISNYERHKTQ